MILVSYHYGNMKAYRLSTRFPIYKKKRNKFVFISRSEVDSWNPRKEVYVPGSFDKSVIEGIYLMKETMGGKKYLRVLLDEDGSITVDNMFMPVARGNQND